MINTSQEKWGNCRSKEGYSEGIHEWILKFGKGHASAIQRGWLVHVVCHSG